MRHRRALAAVSLAAAGGLLLAACGNDNSPARSAPSTGEPTSGKVVEVIMTDMAYTPASLTVAAGDTVTFRFTNRGKAVHEASIGDLADQQAHGTTMSSGSAAVSGGMNPGGHDMASMTDDVVTVQPGKTGQLTYRFDHPGTTLIGCHQPGHYEAGMKATIDVM